MKKFISLLLALVMVLSLSTVAFATGEDGETPKQPVIMKLQKTYTLTNEGTTIPDETFTFTFTGTDVTDCATGTEIPAIEDVTVSFTSADFTGNTATKDVAVTMPTTWTSVGVYHYEVAESTGTNAGVGYSDAKYDMKVTVINGANPGTFAVQSISFNLADGTKSGVVANTYSAGTLKVSKTVDGNLGDKTKYFEFKVTLTGVEGKTYAESFAVTGGSNDANPKTAKLGENTFLLKDGDTISIANLPYGVSYTVTETAANGYTTTKTGETGSINAAEQTAAFINNKNGTVDTGVMLDSLPYILVLAFVAVAGTALILKKRANV